jgi:hypothetical protein
VRVLTVQSSESGVLGWQGAGAHFCFQGVEQAQRTSFLILNGGKYSSFLLLKPKGKLAGNVRTGLKTSREKEEKV